MRFFVRFSYDGAPYHGWQIQPNGITVQEVMQNAFSIVMRREVELTAAGRTDTGVHARMMVAHFDLQDGELSTETQRQHLLSRLNSLLPSTIALHEIFPVAPDAHARFSAVARTYEYHVVTHKDPFLQGRAVRIPADSDFAAMNEAAKYLLVTEDFGSFCKLHTDVNNTLCKVSEAQWTELQAGHYVFRITANRFLRNMVRAIVGTLFDVGMHKTSIEDFKNIIDKQHRTAAGNSAPAEGLYLVNIDYPPDIASQNQIP